jgi:hypothetical protein
MSKDGGNNIVGSGRKVKGKMIILRDTSALVDDNGHFEERQAQYLE